MGIASQVFIVMIVVLFVLYHFLQIKSNMEHWEEENDEEGEG